MSNTVQDIVLTMFRDAHTDKKDKNSVSDHIMLGGGIKTKPKLKNSGK